ncbi:MAG: 23S rRNA (pseudouridine(1915)-N(3))-methyltransferase RlmH [Acidobacteriota bacterium]
MAKIELICIGNQKFKPLIELEKNYEKKIGFFSPFKITLLKSAKSGDEKRTMVIDGEKIIERAGDNSILISLDRRGKEYNSEQFAGFISDKLNYSNRNLIFVIGDAAGLSEDVIRRSDEVISFSKMTFAHDIFKIVFLEQLYRAFTIIKKTGYHRNG